MSKKIFIVIAAMLLVFQFALQIHLAKTDSQTTDEAIHLYAGYRYLVHQDFSYNPEHPPLVKYAAALPLLFMDVHEPEESYASYFERSKEFFFWGDPAQSRVAEDFLYNSGNDPEQILFAGRVSMAVITLLLGALVFIVAWYAWGRRGAILALMFYVLDPTIAAHGHLVTTDIGFAFGTLLSLFALWLFLEKASWKRAAGFGAAVGILLLTKFSALLLFPIFFVLVVWKMWGKSFSYLKDAFVKMAVAGFIAWAVLIAGYGGNFAPAPFEESVVKKASDLNHIEGGWVPDVPFVNNGYNMLRFVLMPSDYLRGLLSFTHHASTGHPAYLLGQNSDEGWWYYFPVVFSAKNFILTLVVFAYAIYLIARYRKVHPVGIFFLVSSALYLALSMASNVNIGIRHIMPIFPLMAVMIGIIGSGIQKSRWIKKVSLVAVFLIAAEFAFVYPSYLSYFNQSYGGMWNGYKVATDSNLDWGQDFHLIKPYLEKHQIAHPYIDYNWNGASSFNHAGITYTHMGDFDKDKDSGMVIIAATFLMQEHYGWLREHPIHDRISPSIFVYKIER